MIGQTLGHYRILERLGQGGMGIVYKALDTKLNRHVAIKVLPQELTADPERRLRFQREAQTAAALNHPSIATIHEVGEHGDSQYIVMEFLEGRTLREVIGHRPMPLKEWLRVALPIAEGLAHAHARHVIHRDLKPDNVMISGEHQVKILDFGLAKLREPEATPTGTGSDIHSRLETISGELSRAGKVFGTVAYMSPEQARGEKTDHRSDLFSFGIVLYQMATGRLPFKGKSDVETLHAVIAQEPTPPSQITEATPQEVERVIRKAMEKEPERRYQDAADLAADLRNLQRDLDSGRVSIPSGVTSGVQVRPRRAWALTRETRKWAFAGIAVLVVLAGVFGYLHFRLGQRAGGAVGPMRKMIVVLPFENLGSPDDDYFAAGMTEEITSRLAAVRGLGVISRKSALQYVQTAKRTKQIGEELGVEYVLEGTVRWARNPNGISRVRITPQLIRVSDDTHLWAQAYDRVIEDIFQVQSEIAEKVIEQLGVTLLEPERRAVSSRPTENLEAYQAYLRGLHYAARPDYSEETIRLRVQMFQRATELDSNFALAFAQLSKAHSALYHHGHDRTKNRQAVARRAVDRALALAPEAPEVHLALGYYYYWGHKEYEPALQEFAIAAKGLPNDSDVLEAIGYVHRRLGRWEETLDHLKKAFELNPLSAGIANNLCETYVVMRRYRHAESACNQSIALVPDQNAAYNRKAFIYWLWKGRSDEARAALEAMPKTSNPIYTASWFWQEIGEGKYREALERLSSSSVDVFWGGTVPKALLAATAYDLLGEPESARRAYDAARLFLEKEVRTRPDDHRAHSNLGIALAGLGRRGAAIHEGKRAMELYPVSKDALAGPGLVQNMALIYTMIGEHDAALDQIEYLLSIPCEVSAWSLRLDPRLRALRQHPRFQKMVEQFG